jgi:beta-phosphoglucomutase-like phosphatase (HAD superfamily)/dTDP-glucose pyrophosphorylase
MVQALLFDLDGVLFDGREFHKKMFLEAVNQFTQSPVSEKYHDLYLDGLSTKQKVEYLIRQQILSEETGSKTIKRKQELTDQNLESHIQPNTNLVRLFQTLTTKYRILCVSNSMASTVNKCLTGLEIISYFHAIISGQDTSENKPSPQPYLTAFLRENLSPSECIIFEDSNCGRTAAYRSGAFVVPIVDIHDLTAEKVFQSISRVEEIQSMEKPTHINVVVPMAGLGSRFKKQGYKQPKPFIPVFTKPMIQWVIENMIPKEEIYDSVVRSLPVSITFHFIVQQEHLDAYNFDELCKGLNIQYTITPIQYITEGAACTVLLVKDKINNDDPLVTVNSDQFLEWNQNEFYRALINPTYDGCISVFEQNDPTDIKWSYSKVDASGFVTEVAEKKYISNWATTGIYGWKKGSDYVHYAEQMIAKNIRVNNEFYVCPVYNEAIGDRKKLRNFLCKKLWGLGVPEDLEIFLKNYSDAAP